MEKRGGREIGKAGEEIACKYLMQRGQTILERNWRAGHLEIDIISLDKDGMHFVEVKSRMAPALAEPQENVNIVKQKRIANAALKYLHSKAEKLDLGQVEVFFDIVAIIFDKEDTEVTYFPKAYIPMYY